MAGSLARLAGHSLLVVLAAPGGTRYRMLEAIRQYGRELLDRHGERDAVGDRLVAWCLRTATALAADEIADADDRDDGADQGDDAVADDRDDGADQGDDAVADELRAVLHWAAGQPGRRADGRGPGGPGGTSGSYGREPCPRSTTSPSSPCPCQR